MLRSNQLNRQQRLDLIRCMFITFQVKKNFKITPEQYSSLEDDPGLSYSWQWVGVIDHKAARSCMFTQNAVTMIL